MGGGTEGGAGANSYGSVYINKWGAWIGEWVRQGGGHRGSCCSSGLRPHTRLEGAGKAGARMQGMRNT